MRKVPTADDRVMHRARIPSNDMQQAVAFSDAALAVEARGAGSKTDVTHIALVVAAVIYYAHLGGMRAARRRSARFLFGLYGHLAAFEVRRTRKRRRRR